MLRSLLLSCLFFGLISMILPAGKKSEWIYLLLLCVLFLSMVSGFSAGNFSLPEPEESSSSEGDSLPESAALSAVISSRVLSLTGEMPVTVESDLERHKDDSYSLTRIRVVIRNGNEKEVQDALQDAFSFEGITVVRAEPDESGGAFNLLP